MAVWRSGVQTTGTGFRPSPRAIVVAVGIALAVAALVYSQMRQRELEIAGATAAAKAWELKGPPCPAPSGLMADPKYGPTKSFVFNGVRFARRFGHADCNAVAAPKGPGPDYYPLCQFTSPAVLEVTTEKGTFKFAPGVGHPATVSVVDGVPSCVIAANAEF
jgi:hypothetical protein